MKNIIYILIAGLLIIPYSILSENKNSIGKNTFKYAPVILPEFNAKITNSIGQEFVYIKPGSFIMGSPNDEADRSYDEKQHRVILTKGFYMQTTEVTREQWFNIMKTTPWTEEDVILKGGDYPATTISLSDAKLFIIKLNKKEKTTKYRLPTEAEWEYACRAGTTSKYSFGNSEYRLNNYAWFSYNTYLKDGRNYYDKQHPRRVGRKRPNPWGLYDIHGNVCEFCSDLSFHIPGRGNELTKMHRDNVTDPLNKEGDNYIDRGGDWLRGQHSCRSSHRGGGIPGYKDSATGFRLVKSE